MKYSIHALHKTATVFLSKFFRDVADSKSHQYFSRDVSEINANLFEHQIDCFKCPDRGFPKVLDTDVVYVFMLRNPLDMLVSEYFSYGWTHPIKGTKEDKLRITTLRNTIQKVSIDDYCLKYADELFTRIKPLLKLDKELPNYHMVTYEKLVTDFRGWAYKMFEIVEVPEYKWERIYLKYKSEFEGVKESTPEEIFKGTANSHKRKILPGDHKEKLKNLTIIKLNNTFKKVLELHASVYNADH